MIFPVEKQEQRLKWAFESCKNGAWGSEPDGENDIVCVRAADFDGQSGRLNDGERTLRAIEPEVFDRIALRPGDLVMEKSGGGEKQLVGRTVLFDDERPSVCSNFLARCRPAESMDSAYLNYLMLAIYAGRGTYPHIKQSTGIQNLDLGSYLDTRVGIPELPVQRRIAGFLDDKTTRIDALIAKKRALLERLAEKRQALITRAVTKGLNPDAPMKPSGIDWLGEIPAHWEVKRLRRIRKYLTSGSRDWAAYYADEGSPFLRMTNVTSHGIELDLQDLRFVDVRDVTEGTRTSVQEGDILITITAELGAVAIVRKEIEGAYINQHLALFRPMPKLCDSDFLVNFLSTDMARQQFFVSGQGGTKQGLGFDQVNDVVVGFAPLEEQKLIGRYCAGIWDCFRPMGQSVATSIEQLVEYRAALVVAAVMGQVSELN